MIVMMICQANTILRKLSFFAVLAGMATGAAVGPLLSQQKSSSIDPLALVDPRIGTSNEGQTYPVVGVPFGMTGWTPETRGTEAKCVSPYYYDDTKITGFRGSHWLSGSCTQDYGTATLMPTVGPMISE